MSRTALDTSFLISALSQTSQDCRRALNLLIQNDTVLIPTIVAAELAVNSGRMPSGIELIAFDSRSAKVLQEKLSKRRIKVEVTGSNRQIGYWRYDAIIVATAVAHGADRIATADNDFKTLARMAGLHAVSALEILPSQIEIPLDPER